MKAERRHELHTNSLALWLQLRGPELLQQYGTKILLALIFLALAVVLIRHRINAPKIAAQTAQDNLALARSIVEELQRGGRAPGEAGQAARLIQDAIERTENPQVQAQGYLALGDYYWTLANWPDLPQAATQRSLRPDLPKNELLAKAEEAYSKAVGLQQDQAYLQAVARMGLAVVAEARAFDIDNPARTTPEQEKYWKLARENYEAIIKAEGVPGVLKDEAQWHLDQLAKIQQPIYLVAATRPSIFAPTTAPFTMPTAPSTEPATKP